MVSLAREMHTPDIALKIITTLVVIALNGSGGLNDPTERVPKKASAYRFSPHRPVPIQRSMNW